MNYDAIVVGSGAAGLISAITIAQKDENKKVLLIEQLPRLASKLKATGGGRCNLSNTLPNEQFISSFGRNSRFITNAINSFNHQDLIGFFKSIGVETHIPDGFRIFPTTHKSDTIIEALSNELIKLNIQIELNTKLSDILISNNEVVGIKTQNNIYNCKNLILATGGLGYPKLGATGEAFDIVKNLGHTITNLYPAMMPLYVKEDWVASCTADTISKVTIKVNLPKVKKLKKLKAIGDIIFTKKGIRGPVVLDFAREITPFLDEIPEVPILINLTKNMNENDIIIHIKKEVMSNPNKNILEIISSILPLSVSEALCKSIGIDPNSSYKNIDGIKKDKLHKILAWTPLNVIGHDGFNNAMITRGGISLKEIDPNTMQSKIIDGLYFVGEIVDIDGPCGGYNLQWAFSSGYLAGKLL
ncbi:MAG: NAD(P)/FAD-dependent oxidoreductase [Campylobacterota bacterium]|nr:NAD(P)/FAD-dependent oxidoreductase [Campylobacterota bacterium]